jgi:hypothetical protein
MTKLHRWEIEIIIFVFENKIGIFPLFYGCTIDKKLYVLWWETKILIFVLSLTAYFICSLRRNSQYLIHRDNKIIFVDKDYVFFSFDNTFCVASGLFQNLRPPNMKISLPILCFSFSPFEFLFIPLKKVR